MARRHHGSRYNSYAPPGREPWRGIVSGVCSCVVVTPRPKGLVVFIVSGVCVYPEEWFTQSER